MIDPREVFVGKRVAVVAAHHDDEVFIFGTLIASIYSIVASLTIVAMSDLREKKFKTVCGMVNATAITIPFKKYSKDPNYFVEDAGEISEKIQQALSPNPPDIVVTHGMRVEGGHYHPFHIMVNLGTKMAFAGKVPIIVRSERGGALFFGWNEMVRKMLKVYDSPKWNNAEQTDQFYSIITEVQ